MQCEHSDCSRPSIVWIRVPLTPRQSADMGEEYLGYKDRLDITEHLRQIFENRNGTQIPSSSSTYSPCVLFLNGFPGVGKLTIARHIRRILSESLLVDNHLLIDPAEAIEPNRTPAHYTLRRAIRQAAFDGLKAVERKSTIFIMTSCTADNPADQRGVLRVR